MTTDTNKIHCGYVIADNGAIYVQVPDEASRFGFRLCDDDQSWDVPPFREWTPISDSDERISDEDRERLQWILDEARA